MILEELPYTRCHLWINDISKDSAAGDSTPLMNDFWEFATRELQALGFVVDGSTRELPEPEVGREGHFSPVERREIALRLDSVEATIIQQHELDREQADWIRGEIGLLREELETSRKVIWRHLARSVLLEIGTMIGGQAGRLIVEQTYDLLRPYLGRWFPFLLGAG